MNRNDNSHVPFVELTLQELFLYWMAARTAIFSLRLNLEAIGVAGEDICFSRVWDEYKFTRADAVDLFSNPKRLETYLIHSVVKGPNFWCPRLAARRSQHRKRR